MTGKKFILAGNFNQYLNWLSENQASRADVHYIFDRYTLMGSRGPHEVIRVGTWYERKDIDEIERELKIRGYK